MSTERDRWSVLMAVESPSTRSRQQGKKQGVIHSGENRVLLLFSGPSRSVPYKLKTLPPPESGVDDSVRLKEPNMKCREVMTENPVCCLPDDNVGQAARAMRRERVSSIPVVTD